MDLDARPMRCFIAVAELNSFSRAALRVNVSQPALSATIKELERRLGFALFDRSSRNVQLTTEGKLFLGNARRYVRESDILRQSWQEIRSNDLRISAAFHTSLISERNRLLAGFLGAHPDVNLQVSNDHHGRGLAKLAQGEVDLLIALEPERPASEAAQSSALGEHHTTIERIILSTRPTGLMVPCEHSLARLGTITLGDLDGCEIVVLNRFHGVAVSEQLRFTLSAAGARPVRAPEGSAHGVEWYGALRRLPAVTLNWFEPGDAESGMVRCPVEGLGMTMLSLIRTTAAMRPAAARCWSHTRQFVGEADAPENHMPQTAADETGIAVL